MKKKKNDDNITATVADRCSQLLLMTIRLQQSHAECVSCTDDSVTSLVSCTVSVIRSNDNVIV